jgi:hypothetical protein
MVFGRVCGKDVYFSLRRRLINLAWTDEMVDEGHVHMGKNLEDSLNSSICWQQTDRPSANNST